MEDKLILVDEADREIGTGAKTETHEQGKMHRAFSVFVFNSKGELLLHKRAEEKYHSGGLWTNTCCSHPRPGEDTEKAAHRKLKQEMGFDCNLKEVFQFTYKVKFDNGLTENEFDHVFIGTYDREPNPAPAEVENWEWVSLDELKEQVRQHPEHYSYWLKDVLPRVARFVKG